MIKIISDTSTLYPPQEALDKGLYINPLHILLNDESYTEYVNITGDQLLTKIKEGAIPTSSQPSIGQKIELYDQLGDDEIIDITIADGLSGTYQSAMMAKESSIHKDKITVFNSKTLCLPQRYLVDEALRMAKMGKDKNAILNMLEKSSATDLSFLIPEDFSFLYRGGRISKTVAGLGEFLKLHMCTKKRDDGKILEKFSVNRTFKKTLASIITCIEERKIDDTYLFGITHADNINAATKAKELILSKFPKAKVEIMPLSCAFIAQGGPGCCAIQMIKIIH